MAYTRCSLFKQIPYAILLSFLILQIINSEANELGVETGPSDGNKENLFWVGKNWFYQEQNKNKLNCTSFVPAFIFDTIARFREKSPSHATSDIDLPQVYLQKCIRNQTIETILHPLPIFTFKFMPGQNELQLDTTTAINKVEIINSAPATNLELETQSISESDIESIEDFKPININIDFGIVKIIDLSYDGRLELIASVFIRWGNAFIPWESKAFKDDYSIFFPTKTYVRSSEIWHPKFTLINCESDGPGCVLEPDNLTYIDLDNSDLQEATYFMDKRFLASCEMDLSYFPKDLQKCDLTFFIDDPFAHDFTRLMRMSDEGFLLYSYFPNDEFVLSGISMSVNSNVTARRYVPSAEHPYLYGLKNAERFDFIAPTLKYQAFIVSLELQRSTNYYWYTLLGPLGVNVFVSCTSTLLPRNSEGKLSLVASALASHIFLLTVITDIMPRSRDDSTEPLLAIYVFLTIALLALYLAHCVGCVLSEVFRGEESKPVKEVPLFISLLFIQPSRAAARLIEKAYSKARNLIITGVESLINLLNISCLEKIFQTTHLHEKPTKMLDKMHSSIINSRNEKATDQPKESQASERNGEISQSHIDPGREDSERIDLLRAAKLQSPEMADKTKFESVIIDTDFSEPVLQASNSSNTQASPLPIVPFIQLPLNKDPLKSKCILVNENSNTASQPDPSGQNKELINAETNEQENERITWTVVSAHLNFYISLLFFLANLFLFIKYYWQVVSQNSERSEWCTPAGPEACVNDG